MNTFQKIILAGGAGFIGSACVRLAVQNGYTVTVIDKLTYAGDLAHLKNVMNRITFHPCDIRDHPDLDAVLGEVRPDAVLNFAAETHVDRSILLRLLGKSDTLSRFVADRPSHDFCYMCEYLRLPQIEWQTEIPLEDGLITPIDWVQSHFTWMQQKTHDLAAYWQQIYNTKDDS